MTSGDVSSTRTPANDYEPACYDGYFVFYTDDGRPFHYGPHGSLVFIDPTSSYYEGLANHYRVNVPSYTRWNAESGYRYHAYRGPAGHYYYAGYVHF